MKLMTKEILKKLPKLYANDTKSEEETKIIVKFFDPTGSYTFYCTEFDGEDTMFGYVTGLGSDELGYTSLSELKSVRGRLGLGIERDMHWDSNTTLDQVKRGERR